MKFKVWLEKFEKVELTPSQKAARQRKKNAGISNLSKNLKSLNKQISKDLNSDDETVKLTAAAVKTMLDTSERVGNKTSERNGHHGVTGLKARHLTKANGFAKLSYTGKSGMHHNKEIKDKRVIDSLSSRGSLFRTKDNKEITNLMVNDYLRKFNITSKDIRGYNANKYMSQELSKNHLSDEKDRKKRFLEILKTVAEKVGHTPSMLRNSYLTPGLEDEYVKHGRIKQPGK